MLVYFTRMSIFKISDDVWLPFWVLIEYLDPNDQDPFIKCKIVDKKTSNLKNAEGNSINTTVCDLQIKKDLIAHDIPEDYLITDSELKNWAEKIGKWFIDFPSSIT